MSATHTAAPSAAVALVADIYAAFGRGDIPAILDRLAPDVDWDAFPDSFAARAGVSYLTPRRGPEAVAGFFAEVGTWTTRGFDVQAIIGDDTAAVVRVTAEFERPGGGAFRDEELHLWRLGEDGKVVEFRHYVDTAKHIAAYGGEDTRR